MNLINEIIDYENGELEFNEVITLFKKLIKTGYINQLQGSYQRTARDLWENGYLE